MPPVGAAVAGLLGIGGAISFAGIGTALVKVAAGMGLTYITRALAGSPDELLGGDQATPGGVQATIVSGDSNARSFLVGKFATAGLGVFLRPWGETNKYPHAYLVQIVRISDLPIDNIRQILVDGVHCTYPNGAAGSRGYAVPEFRKDGKDYLWIKIYKGTQSGADDYLVDKFKLGGRDWTTAHVGRGVAYAIVTSRYNEKLFDGRPECLFVCDGLRLYDPTQDSSVGGVGLQRWADPATYAWSSNPAVIIYNIMRGIREPWLSPTGPGGAMQYQWVYGLQTVAASQLPLSAWMAAINECDLVVTNRNGSKNEQFRAGAEISFDTEAGAEIEEFLKSCNGRLADCGGVYKIKVGASVSSGAPVFSFTDSNLVLTDEHSFSMFPTLDDVVNGVDATFIAPGDAWQEKALPPKRVEKYIAEDDRRYNIADVTYAHVWDSSQAQRLSKAILNESRRFRRHVLVLPPEAYILEPLDFVRWTSSRNGYVNKIFRVESVSDLSNGDQVIGIQEVDPTDYDWSAVEEIIVPDGQQVIERPPAQALASFTVAAATSVGGDGRSIAVIRTAWNGADLDDVDRVKFEVTNAAGTAVVARAEMLTPGAGTFDIAAGINGATAYKVRAILADAQSHRDFSWTPYLSVTTTNTKIVSNEMATSLINLINAGSASGKVLTGQVLPTPAGFQSLYRITVYGTGPTPVASGLYAYVTSTGVPGIILDAANFAVGPFSSVPGDVATKTKVFPFVIGSDGIVRLKRGFIEKLQSNQIDAGAIEAVNLYSDTIEAKKIKVEHIKGGEISTRWYSGVSDGKASVTVKKKGAILLVGTFQYKIDKEEAAKVAICKAGSNSPISDANWKMDPGDDMSGAGQVVTIIDQTNNDTTYEIRRIEGDGAINRFKLVAMRVAP